MRTLLLDFDTVGFYIIVNVGFNVPCLSITEVLQVTTLHKIRAPTL